MFVLRLQRALPTSRLLSRVPTRLAVTSTARVNGDGVQVKPYAEIPGPRGLPFLGTLLQSLPYRSKTHEFFEMRHKRYGRIYREPMGKYDFVFISDVNAIQQLYRQESKTPSRFPLETILEQRRLGKHAIGVFLAEGEDWLRQRRVVNKHLMKVRSVEAHTGGFCAVAEEFLQRLAKIRKPGTSEVPQFDNELFNWSLESAYLFLLEERLGSLGDNPDPESQKMIDAVHEMFEHLSKIVMFTPMFAKIFLRSEWKKYCDSTEAVFDYTIKCIKRRLVEIKRNPTPEGQEMGFLEFLMSNDNMSREETLANISEMLGAAVDTTSNTVLLTLYELARNPETQKKLYEELSKAAAPGLDSTADDLQNVPYLKAVIKESMRLYPIGAIISRSLPQDSVIMGYNIPKGTRVAAALYGLGRDETLYPDPEKFLPERWLRNDDQSRAADDKVNPFAHLPFGFGPRMCVGRRLAELEMQVLLFKLLRRFRVESVKPLTGPMELRTALLILPKHPVELRLLDR